MEFGVALFGAVASAAVAKLGMVISEKLSSGGESARARNDAECIKAELNLIKEFIRNSYKGLSGHVNIMQDGCIEILRCLAYDIEDCIDLFDAEKTTLEVFSIEIHELKERTDSTHHQIEFYLRRAEGFIEAAQVLDGDELRILVAEPTGQAWLAENLNCLLYICLFPANYDVSTMPLRRRWLAEGLVQGEDVATEILQILITADIISSNQRISNNGYEEICRRTDEMHRCILRRNRSQNFVLVCDSANPNLKQADKARRLAVHRSAHVQLSLPERLSHVRTLAVFQAHASAAAGGAPATLPSHEDVLDFSSYKVLRVLDLKESAPLTKKHFNDIVVDNSQVLMKYLSINLGNIDSISKKIQNLNQLETLDLSVSGNQIVKVFEEVLLLPKLKHLLGKFKFNFQESLPWSFHNGLKEFLRDDSELETLEGFVTGKRYGFEDLMGCMKCLRKVKIWCKDDASEKNLGDLSKSITKFISVTTDAPQDSWSLSIDFGECSTEFLNEIEKLPGILASLKLQGGPGEFPQFVAALSVITELCLCSTGMSWEAIRAGLEKNVKGLKHLKLVENKLVHFNIPPEDDHLRSIVRICIVSSTSLNITIPDEALPLLESLHILCQALNVSPANGGIKINHMKKLEEIVLHPQVAEGIKTGWQNAVNFFNQKQAEHGVQNGFVPAICSLKDLDP